MTRELVVAYFRDEDAASRAAADLRGAGIGAWDIAIRAGERGGARLLVRMVASKAAADRIVLILEQHRPERVQTKPDDASVPQATTLSGAPADHGVSAGTVPQAEPDTDWLVRKEGELAAEFDPDPEPNQP